MTWMQRIVRATTICVFLSAGFAFAVDTATPASANTTTGTETTTATITPASPTPGTPAIKLAKDHSFSKILSEFKNKIEEMTEHLESATTPHKITNSSAKTQATSAVTSTTSTVAAPAVTPTPDQTAQPATTQVQTLTTTAPAANSAQSPVAAISSSAAAPLADQEANTKPAMPTDDTPLSKYIKNNDSTNPQPQAQNQKITLNFSNIPSRELIQIFAQFTGLNFIVSDNVKGNTSVHLENIPWQQALEAILKSEGLDQRRIGNAIIIAPIEEIANQEAKELEAEQKIEQIKYKNQIDNLQSVQKIEDLQPLVNRVITLNYAKASDIKDLLTKDGSLLSPRGKVGVDTSSNSIWIRDTELYADSLSRLIKRLDSPVRQVLIEARIVKIERPYEKSLGIRWGVTSKENNLSGNLSGANYTTGSQYSTPPVEPQGPQPLVQPVLTDRLNFNTPASALNNGTLTPASVGLAYAQLGNFNIDLEISALEYEGKLETISKPRLVTSNLQTAKISTGEEIPYNEATSSGATSISFKEAALSLEVTPRITPDNRVILTLKVANDQQGDSVPVGTGTAVTIDTEQEESQVLVDNNQTIVLGGVFKLQKNKTITRIPFLGQLPIVGYLFKQTVWKNSRSELLIFLTPKIINKPADLNED